MPVLPLIEYAPGAGVNLAVVISPFLTLDPKPQLGIDCLSLVNSGLYVSGGGKLEQRNFALSWSLLVEVPTFQPGLASIVTSVLALYAPGPGENISVVFCCFSLLPRVLPWDSDPMIDLLWYVPGPGTNRESAVAGRFEVPKPNEGAECITTFLALRS